MGAVSLALLAIAFLFRKHFGAWGDKPPVLAETLMAKGKVERLFLYDQLSMASSPSARLSE
jgi:hypothetical protein